MATRQRVGLVAALLALVLFWQTMAPAAVVWGLFGLGALAFLLPAREADKGGQNV